jgi:hypothetical protein
MKKTRIALDFEDDDMEILTKAQEIARRKFGCKTTGATIRAILRAYVDSYERAQETK